MKSLDPEAGGPIATVRLFAVNAQLFCASLGCKEKGHEDVQLAAPPTSTPIVRAWYTAPSLPEQAGGQARERSYPARLGKGRVHSILRISPSAPK